MAKKQTSGNLALEQQRVIVIPVHDEIVARKLRVAAYARVSSSSEDQLNSYRVQNQYYSELISNNPDWEMVDIYADEGITGTSVEKREDFQRMMLDAEIYVDRIADMRITNMNATMEAVRQSVIKKKGNDQEDLYLRTLELAQVQEDEYFGHVVSKDLTGILRDISDTHRKDATTADEVSATLDVRKQLQDAMDYKGSTEEKKARLFLANLGIDYDALTMEQFANLIEVLKLSKHMNSPISQRGKGSMTHGKGKRKRK